MHQTFYIKYITYLYIQIIEAIRCLEQSTRVNSEICFSVQPLVLGRKILIRKKTRLISLSSVTHQGKVPITLILCNPRGRKPLIPCITCYYNCFAWETSKRDHELHIEQVRMVTLLGGQLIGGRAAAEQIRGKP